MAAILRQGAKIIGGSVLRRTQAAVTLPAVVEERRRLVPRRMATDAEAQAMQEIQRMKEELYVALSKVESWRNMSLLQDLAAHVKPRAHDKQWHRLRAARRADNIIEATGTAGLVSFAVILGVVHVTYGQVFKRAATLQKNQEQLAKTLAENQ